jgi:hypothetical protein
MGDNCSCTTRSVKIRGSGQEKSKTQPPRGHERDRNDPWQLEVSRLSYSSITMSEPKLSMNSLDISFDDFIAADFGIRRKALIHFKSNILPVVRFLNDLFQSKLWFT